MRDPYINPATTYALARRDDLLAEAARERRLALAPTVRPTGPNPVTLLRQAVAGLGGRRAAPCLPTTATTASATASAC